MLQKPNIESEPASQGFFGFCRSPESQGGSKFPITVWVEASDAKFMNVEVDVEVFGSGSPCFGSKLKWIQLKQVFLSHYIIFWYLPFELTLCGTAGFFSNGLLLLFGTFSFSRLLLLYFYLYRPLLTCLVNIFSLLHFCWIYGYPFLPPFIWPVC